MSTHFIDRIGLVIVYNSNLKRLGKLDDRTLLDVDNVLYREKDLDAVSVIVGSKYNLLQSLHPFFSTSSAVRFEEVCPLMCCYSEVGGILAFVLLLRKGRRYAISQVNVSAWKVKIRWIGIVGEHIAFQGEPVALEVGILFAAFGEMSRFSHYILEGREFLKYLYRHVE